MNKEHSAERSTRIIDILAVSASILITVITAVWLLRDGMLYRIVTSDSKLSWHLVRATGITAYGLLLGSMIWGLLVSSQFVKDWSPGALSTTLHSTLSWLAVLISLVHAVLLMFDKYFAYSIGDILIPFTGPYRPVYVGLGTLSFWLMLVIAVSFPLKRRIGQTWWKRIHIASFAVFGLVTVHGLTAGTDGEHIALRVMMGIGVIVVILLLGIRLGKDQGTSEARDKGAARAARKSPSGAPAPSMGSTTSNRAP